MLAEVSNQMLELYEQNRVASQSHANEAEGSSVGGASHLRTTSKSSPASEEPTRPIQTSSSSRPMPDQSHIDRQKTSQRLVQSTHHDHTGKEVSDWHHEPSKFGEALSSKSAYRTEHHLLDEPGVSFARGAAETKAINSMTADAMSKIDKDKVKAALEKRKRSREDLTKKADLVDEDDLIERELESGIELAAEDEHSSEERKQSWYRTENGIHRTSKEMQNSEGEVPLADRDFHGPDPMNWRRKEGYEFPYHHPPSLKHRDPNDSLAMNRPEHGERDHKRTRQGNQI